MHRRPGARLRKHVAAWEKSSYTRHVGRDETSSVCTHVEFAAQPLIDRLANIQTKTMEIGVTGWRQEANGEIDTFNQP